MKLFIFFFLLTSCSSYVNSVHRQINQEERAKMGQKRNYRYQGDRRPIANPVTLSGSAPSANTVRNYNPNTKRRYRAEDLRDNDDDGSLWSGKQSGNFLFVTNNVKKKGDIVIVEVMGKLKDKIQEELKRNFPDPVKKKKKGDDEEKKEGEAAANTATPAPPTDPGKVYDKISTQVVEQVNQDYLLLRGRKEVIFKEAKRYFEFQAIVSQKDITDNDTVGSLKVLEPRVNVLRY